MIAKVASLAFVTAIMMSGAAKSQPDCGDLNRAVYDIVDTAKKNMRVGVATLVAARSGVFLMSKHLLGRPDYRLSYKGKQYSFLHVSDGGNDRPVIDDWALVRAIDDKGDSASFSSADGIELSYDLIEEAAINDASVLSGTGGIADVKSSRIKGEAAPGGECTTSMITLARVEDYDKGDSGSSLYLNARCQVVAITSQFDLDVDTKGTSDELVDLFYTLSENEEVKKNMIVPSKALQPL